MQTFIGRDVNRELAAKQDAVAFFIAVTGIVKTYDASVTPSVLRAKVDYSPQNVVVEYEDKAVVFGTTSVQLPPEPSSYLGALVNHFCGSPR